MIKVFAKDVVKSKTYWLTYDFYPHGGDAVFLKSRVPAKMYYKGAKGHCLIMCDDKKNTFVIHPYAWLFGEDPKVSDAVREYMKQIKEGNAE